MKSKLLYLHMQKPQILIVYTGGTIGMIQDEQTGELRPLNFEYIPTHVSELNRIDCELTIHSFDPLMDSSNMHPDVWILLGELIEKNYDKFDGFVILHGSDTMAYTASALSFMLENLSKPVIITGSQLPVGVIRTDAKENLITAIEIAAHKTNGVATVPEVAIYFDYQLMRGNRAKKFNTVKFEAFRSTDYHILAEAGVHLKFYPRYIEPARTGPFAVQKVMDNAVGTLKVYPGMPQEFVRPILLNKAIKALIIEGFGAGNATTMEWFVEALNEAVQSGLIVVIITQCQGGAVDLGRYETSGMFKRFGCISGADMTYEAALTKLMYLLAKHDDKEIVKKMIEVPISGELTV